MSYNHQTIDAKWQAAWAESKIFHALDSSPKEKYYCLVEFPYPSGAGLHVGHPRSYTALDIVARQARMLGKNVLFPMGWDAFGLPTENFAIKHNLQPAVVTKTNIDTFRRQLQSIGFSFDWAREINTTDPAYYKWTQWMFIRFFNAGLAYKSTMAINWCPKDKIGLANEEVIGGKCERCGTAVAKRDKEQWMIAITKYADRLIDDLDTVDYLPKIKKQQIDWIGRSEGAEIAFGDIVVFTTRPDTIDGVTYVVLAPEHPLVSKLTIPEHRLAVNEYLSLTSAKTDMERGDETKAKTGVATGSFVTNPANGEQVPVWVADYVLGHYGTGAVMAVPQHDERDLAFAETFNLPIVDRPLLSFDDALAKTAGKKTVQYKLRDWVFSRQRYWGEPIPLINCSHCGWVPVPDDQLPVLLPDVANYQPTDTGESPLASIDAFVNTKCSKCGGAAKRETDTMPNWAGSSWYFLRYLDPTNDKAFADPAKLKHWMPIDLYNGGMEHTTLHLLYSRFWNKFLFDQGLVPTSEPYARRHSHGLIMADDGTKMSKSVGNVINPDDIVAEFGADTLRVYEVFMGPFEEPVPWSTNGVVGVRRFLDRVTKLPSMLAAAESAEVTKALHKTIKKVSEDITNFRFNTAVAAMMTFVNTVYEAGSITKQSLTTFLAVLTPFAPHVGNEVNEALGNTGFVEAGNWPVFDPALIIDSEVTIVIQVNGKLRSSLTVALDLPEAEVIALASADPNVTKFLTSPIKKTIVVPNKIVNFVI
jgi:leucyl-tRNA synthetase